jgi:hypothetical protein
MLTFRAGKNPMANSLITEKTASMKTKIANRGRNGQRPRRASRGGLCCCCPADAFCRDDGGPSDKGTPRTAKPSVKAAAVSEKTGSTADVKKKKKKDDSAAPVAGGKTKGTKSQENTLPPSTCVLSI